MEILKMFASFIMGLLGMYYMYRGKKTQNTKMILWGAGLTIASYFLFAGGGSDSTTQSLLNSALPSTPGEQP